MKKLMHGILIQDVTSQEELFARINGNYFGKVLFGDDSIAKVKRKSTFAISRCNRKKKFINDTLISPTLRKKFLLYGTNDGA